MALVLGTSPLFQGGPADSRNLYETRQAKGPMGADDLARCSDGHAVGDGGRREKGI